MVDASANANAKTKLRSSLPLFSLSIHVRSPVHLEREGVRLLWAAPNIDTIKPQVFGSLVALKGQPLVMGHNPILLEET